MYYRVFYGIAIRSYSAILVLENTFAKGRISMLILTRRIQEKIIINDDMVITVLEIDEDQVRLGVIAPKDILIRRGEGKLQANKKE